jgi:transcriptional antiterminator RfaH
MREKRAGQLEMPEGLRWYAVQAKHKKETTVEKRFKDLKLEVFLPWVRLRRRIGSRYRWTLAPLFPGYLFCRMDIVLSGKAARYTPGVKDFVRLGNRIAEVGEDVIGCLFERCPNGVAEVESRP